SSSLSTSGTVAVAYAGPAGTLTVGTASTPGSANTVTSGALQLISGALQANTTVVLTNAVTLTNSNIVIGGSSNITLSGVPTLAGSNNTVVSTNTATTVFSGNETGNVIWTLKQSGSGTLVLTGTNATTAQVLLIGGIVNTQSAQALG